MLAWKAQRAIEFALLLVILALTIGFCVPLYISTPGAPAKATEVSLSNVRAALFAFKTQVGRYPTTAEGLSALVEVALGLPGRDHQYLEKIPQDGWHRMFRYRFPGVVDPLGFDLVSAGKDGKFDTADDIPANVP